MDPLSILGVAAATAQFVDFGQRLLSETWQIYRSASGQTLQLESLSVVSADILRLSTTVKKAFRGQDQSASVSEDSNTELLRLCRECDDIATKILAVMPKVCKAFQGELAEDEKDVQRAVERPWLGKHKPRSVGECFRVALRTWWEREEIAEISERLEKVRQGIMIATTISIWHNSQSTKNWEHQFSNKLDTMIGMLSQSLETAGHSGPEQKHSNKKKVVEETAAASMRQNNVTDQIISRLWRVDWKPDPATLESFPQQTELSAGELNSAICDSLRFDTMDNREEAITKTFDCTFRWAFDRAPQISLEGVPMWSSFPDWLEGDSGLPYWITGKPGSGKSTMMKFILQHPALHQHLRTWSQGSPLHIIKYYAWKPGAEMARSEDGLLRTLLHQLLKVNPGMLPHICPRRWSLFHAVREIGAFPPWTMRELEESFERLLQLQLREDGPRLALFIDGLDEFDTATVDLCKRVETISSHRTVKVCVASRPWPQFSDAFAASPGLQMHLLTHTDIQVFVRGHFRGIAAFRELEDVYNGGGEALLVDIVKKAKGVFLWTALVTQMLLEHLIDGSGLPRLKEILDTMPSEIENLYDAIYATIPERLLPEVSAMLQLYVCAFQPVHWVTLWLADEARGTPTAALTQIQKLDMEKAQATLQRRLGARTRGILELVPQTRRVEYLHRTAAEWVNCPRVWEKIRSLSPRCFDPHACLLQAETIHAQNTKFLASLTIVYFWTNVAKALHHASQVDGSIISEVALVAVLDQFYEASIKSLGLLSGVYNRRSTPWAIHEHTRSLDGRANTFNGIATQFAILPYIRHKFNSNPVKFHSVPSRRSIALLEQAVLGPWAYFAPETMVVLDQLPMPTASSTQRLQLVEFLLQRGVRQLGVLSLIEDRRSSVQNEEYAKYLDAVMELLRRYHATGGEKRLYVKRLFGLV